MDNSPERAKELADGISRLKHATNGSEAYYALVALSSSHPDAKVETEKGELSAGELLDMVHEYARSGTEEDLARLPEIIRAAAQFDTEQTRFELPEMGSTVRKERDTLSDVLKGE